MKKLFATAAALAITATAAMAEPLTTWQADDYVKSASQRVAGTNTYAPGLLVKANGVKSFHFIGDGGVTSDMVFTDHAAAVAWAENLTGGNIRAVGFQRNHNETEERIVKRRCAPPKIVEVRVAHQDLVWR